MGYLIAVLVRLLWSLTIGLPFFLIGFVSFLILDIFFPDRNTGFRVLTKIFQWGSCYWFKGIKLVPDEYEVEVEKKRPHKSDVPEVEVGKQKLSYVMLDNGFTGPPDEAMKEKKPMVAKWEQNMGLILKSSRLPGKWVDGEPRRMLREDWEALVKVKLLAAGTLQDTSGQKSTPAEFEQQEKQCIDRIEARWKTR
jgi:hypothetical protein